MKFAEAYRSSPVNAAARFVETRKPVTIRKEINKTKVRKCVYFCEMFSLPSLIKLYRMSILLFIPIIKPTEINNSKSNAMVAGTTVELLISIIPRWLGPNKLPINKIDIVIRDVVPITNTACICPAPFT